ncbi:MAG TPA: hypothetical protein VMK12_31600 [Anaeromyxobacteraceae bacterium]|nr:hypothetical protein [Anaeromyxobacteraceae bacterium]
MTCSSLFILVALAAPRLGAIAPPIQAAFSGAIALPGARAEVIEVVGDLPARCVLTHAETPQPVAFSTRMPLHLFGSDPAGETCDAWAFARVRVKAPSLVTTRPVAEGAPLDGAVAPSEREVLPGRPLLAALPEGAVAARALATGTVLDDSHLRLGPRPGDPVAVALRAGALLVEQQGQAVACRRGRACALLPSGRRVEGQWHDGRILLEEP